MSESTWAVSEPRKFTFDAPVTTLKVRIFNGTVNVVGSEESSARLEVSAVHGPPLIVTREGSTLTIAYEDLPWRGFLKMLDRRGWNRSAEVSLAVPAGTDVEVGTVGAGAVVSGIRGRTEVRGVSGDTTLVGLSGPVVAESVTGALEAHGVTGELRFKSVSGGLTVIEGAGPRIHAETVKGDMVLDLTPDGRPTDIRLTTVAGEVAVRLPHPADARIEASTTSGAVSNGFDDLRVSGQWGTKRIIGTLGAGNGTLKATTVSGSIALLRRPAGEEDYVPEDGPVGGGPIEDAPIEDTPVEDAPIGAGPIEDTPVEDAPPAGAPSDRASHDPSDRSGSADSTNKKVL
ncbi:MULTISPECIES: DUF4097 family beta strand repeat-containing protein [unclassified Streptomyces]|uniref:DUF4097 family beta strand repeat-containing protein n=1 Tax=unclassified Streptomyces TaxID=2593676 RepID=UPI003816AE92